MMGKPCMKNRKNQNKVEYALAAGAKWRGGGGEEGGREGA